VIPPTHWYPDANIDTNQRVDCCRGLQGGGQPGSTALDAGEIVTEIQVPAFSGKSAFYKFALRTSIDFPIANCAAAIDGNSARICLNAVYNMPCRATAAEEAIAGKSIDAANPKQPVRGCVIVGAEAVYEQLKVQIAKVC
jgi:xanthine dehydrogenase YagS FAD-binding subunit